jgi:DNA-binding MarR family transcriptional regulator
MMEDQVRQLQQLYPRIYIACHTDHVRAATSAVQLSARDSAILAHFEESKSLRPSKLARHLGIARSTLSQALKKLVALGYISSQKNEADRRHLNLQLTTKGREAMQAASVLDKDKVAQLLRQLTPAERKTGLEGLSVLARAAGTAMLKSNKTRRKEIP